MALYPPLQLIVSRFYATTEAEAALAHAAELFMEMSRLSQAGKVRRAPTCVTALVPDCGAAIMDVACMVQIFKQIAEMHEEAHNSEKALEFYERAADTFRADVRPGRA